jgi:hypothetical protein
MIARDGRIIAVVDFENSQTNMPQSLKLFPQLQFSPEMDKIFRSARNLEYVLGWRQTRPPTNDTITAPNHSRKLRLYVHSKDFDSLKCRVKKAGDVHTSIIKASRDVQ